MLWQRLRAARKISATKLVEKQIVDIDSRLAEATKQANDLEHKYKALAATSAAKEKEFWSSGGDLSRNRDAIKLEMERSLLK